jgi:hypothetical protein
MVDFQSLKAHFEYNNLSYYSLYPKSGNPIKAVIHHLPKTPLQMTAEKLGDLSIDVISSIRLMSNNRLSPEGTPITLPLIFVTLPRTTNPKICFNSPASATFPSR